MLRGDVQGRFQTRLDFKFNVSQYSETELRSIPLRHCGTVVMNDFPLSGTLTVNEGVACLEVTFAAILVG